MFPLLGKLHAGKFVTIVALLACFWKKGDILDHWFVSKALLIWLAICLISVPFALNPALAWDSFNSLVKTCIIYYLVYKGIDSAFKMKIFLILFWLQHLKLSVWQLGVYKNLVSGGFAAYHIQEGVGAGSTGFMGNAGDFGVGLCVLIPLVIFLFFAMEKKIIKLGVIVSIPVFLMSLVATGSRASAIGFLGEVVSPAISKKNLRMAVTALIIIVIIIVTVWSIAPVPYKNRFKSALNYKNDPTAMQRLNLFASGIMMFKQQPVLGVGIGNFRYAFIKKYKPENYGPTEGRYAHAIVSHNNFINSLAETGLLGFIAYCALILRVFSCNFKTKRLTETSKYPSGKLSVALNASLVSFVITGMLITTIYYPHLFLLAGLSVANYNLASDSA